MPFAILIVALLLILLSVGLLRLCKRLLRSKFDDGLLELAPGLRGGNDPLDIEATLWAAGLLLLGWWLTR